MYEILSTIASIIFEMLVFIALLTLGLMALVKSIHFIREMIWLFKEGDNFANEVEKVLEGVRVDDLQESIYNIRRQTHVIIYPLLVFADKGSKMRKAAISFFVNYIYRMPLLVTVIATIGYFSQNKVVVSVAGTLVAWCVLTQACYLVLSRIIMGTADNFYHPFIYIDPEADALHASRWKQRHLLRDFLFRFLIIFSVFAYGTGFFHYSIEVSIEGEDYSFKKTVHPIIAYTYFSIVVITTTGFGDISPTSSLALVTTSAEIIITFLFVIVLLFSVSLTINLPRNHNP